MTELHIGAPNSPPLAGTSYFDFFGFPATYELSMEELKEVHTEYKKMIDTDNYVGPMI
jgi:hypothetical protein